MSCSLIAQVKTDMEQLLQQHTKSQADHTKAWEMERLTLESEINTLRANLQTEKEKEIEKSKSKTLRKSFFFVIASILLL